MSGSTAAHLSVKGVTTMHRYFEVHWRVHKCQAVRPAICLLKVILQCTDIVRYSRGYRNVKWDDRPSVDCDTAIY
jgi:hypothetical protein